MSKDIRSFFQSVSKKKDHSGSISASKKIKNKSVILIDSDDDDIIKETPTKDITKKLAPKRKVQLISSDSEDESKKKTKPSKINKQSEEKPKLIPVNINDVFNNTPVKQSKVETIFKKEPQRSPDKKKKRTKEKVLKESDIHKDDDFEKTLLDLDDDIILQNIDILDKTVEDVLNRDNKNSAEAKEKEINLKESLLDTSTKLNKKRQRNNSDGTPSKKPKMNLNDSGVDDQEIFERKRYSAMLYQKYKNRSGPKHHGEKELPKGKPNCLRNLTFLRTGVLDSLEGNEFENLVVEHGGRVVHGVSRKVNFVVVGEEPGPAKLEKASSYNIPQISEDDLLDMILVKSGMKPKFCKNNSEGSTESGIVMEEDSPPKSKKKDAGTIKKEEKIIDKEDSAIRTKKSKIMKEESPIKEKTVPKTEKPSEKPRLQNLLDKHDKKQKKSKEATIKKEPSTTGEVISKATVKSEDLPKIDRPKIVVEQSAMSWTEKYKPKDTKGIIGQQDQNSNMNKLIRWLDKWSWNQKPEVHKKLTRPSPWAKDDNGGYFKAALLSGPPGVGKTTTATLVAKELGFDVVEFNASDTRSKKLLHEEVSQLLSTTTIAGFAAGKKTTDKKRVLLMDEVDGMAGNEDRGGMQELINLIKTSNVPIICMCNDRNHQKMRSLVNYCFDLKFNKPNPQQIRGAMMSVCFKEGLKVSANALSEIIEGTGCDVRQTLNHLALWTSNDKNLSVETVQKEARSAKKDSVLGPWEVVRMVFSESEQKNMSLADKSRLFFYDYSLGPLFVQENYLGVKPNCKRKEEMKRAALAADAISMGDIIESKIRSKNNWSLLDSQSYFSSVFPGFYMSGTIVKRINFPGWLGKNSSGNKMKRMLGELYVHTRTSTSGSKQSLKLDYIVPLRDSIINPLKKYGVDGVHQAIEVMKAYHLLREDLNNLIELCQWKHKANPFNSIEAKVKSAFTRTYNKEAPLLTFAPPSVSKKKGVAADSELLEDDIESDVEEKDDISVDSMIKVKASKAGTSKAGTSKASASKAKMKAAPKGKGKK